MGFKQVEVECDALEVVEVLIADDVRTCCRGLIKDVKELLKRDWNVQVKHVFREANRCADKLAETGGYLKTRRAIWVTPPSQVLEILQQDCAGVETPRRIQV